MDDRSYRLLSVLATRPNFIVMLSIFTAPLFIQGSAVLGLAA
jgi:hypothetical protein